jgi:hypothetical protein
VVTAAVRSRSLSKLRVTCDFTVASPMIHALGAWQRTSIIGDNRETGGA